MRVTELTDLPLAVPEEAALVLLRVECVGGGLDGDPVILVIPRLLKHNGRKVSC